MNDHERNFQKIYRRWQPKILRYLTRLAGEHEAEDLAQEVFLRAGKALGKFEGRAQISTWLYRIATNVAMDRFRSRSYKQSRREDSSINASHKMQENLEDRNVWTGSKPPAVEATLIREEMWACIKEFIDKLPVSYRTVVVLSDLEGLKNREIAEILGVSLETVKIRLHNGRAKLRKAVESHCGLYRDARHELKWDGRRP